MVRHPLRHLFFTISFFFSFGFVIQGAMLAHIVLSLLVSTMRLLAYYGSVEVCMCVCVCVCVRVSNIYKLEAEGEEKHA